ncbi:MAG: Gp15 family bacteriophage protein [Coprobacillus cateniformis]
MHWYQFIHFIQGFTEESMMSRIRELRNYDLSDIKDQKVKRKVMEAQKGVELSTKLSSEDQKAVDEFESLFI